MGLGDYKFPKKQKWHLGFFIINRLFSLEMGECFSMGKMALKFSIYLLFNGKNYI